jgi:hypothetical protein
MMVAQMRSLIHLLGLTRRELGKYSGWDQKLLKKLASARKYNGKQPLTKTSTTVSSPWKKGQRPSKKMERTGIYESE